MAKSTKKKPAAKDDEPEVKNICQNRRARHEYLISDTIECGIVLVGTEVKALRDGLANLEDAYAKVDDGEVFLVGCEIAEYKMGNRLNHAPKRQRKLLLRRSEIAKIAEKADEKGFTLVPLRLYFKDGKAKVEIGVAKGKQTHDKRQSLKSAEAKREMDRAASVRKRR